MVHLINTSRAEANVQPHIDDLNWIFIRWTDRDWNTDYFVTWILNKWAELASIVSLTQYHWSTVLLFSWRIDECLLKCDKNVTIISNYCACTNWANVQWMAKRTKQHIAKNKTTFESMNICLVKSLIPLKFY